MTSQQKSSKAYHITLWVLQVILAIGFIYGGLMKLLQPIEKLSLIWPWTGQIPVALVKVTGALDLLVSMGFILPSLLRIKPKLVIVTAICAFAYMVCASVFHIIRGEASDIGVNIVFGGLVLVIVWGRTKKAPIMAR